MHPGFFGWWKRGNGCGNSHGPEAHGAEASECGPRDCGPGGFRGHRGGWGPGHGGGHGGPHHGGPPDWGGGDGGGFGVRRPLRFLAWKLELEEEQVGKLAVILDELKTERAQAAVDERRSITGFAEAVGGDTFDADKAREAGDNRVKSAERLRDAVVRALTGIHEILDAEQRKRLAYLLRTGALTI